MHGTMSLKFIKFHFPEGSYFIFRRNLKWILLRARKGRRVVQNTRPSVSVECAVSIFRVVMAKRHERKNLKSLI